MTQRSVSDSLRRREGDANRSNLKIPASLRLAHPGASVSCSQGRTPAGIEPRRRRRVSGKTQLIYGQKVIVAENRFTYSWNRQRRPPDLRPPAFIVRQHGQSRTASRRYRLPDISITLSELDLRLALARIRNWRVLGVPQPSIPSRKRCTTCQDDEMNRCVANN